MKITKTSMISGITRTRDLDVTIEELARWKNGMVIQKALPNLSASDREFLMTGVTEEEWDETFGDESLEDY
jgi:hypothetical protein